MVHSEDNTTKYSFSNEETPQTTESRFPPETSQPTETPQPTEETSNSTKEGEENHPVSKRDERARSLSFNDYSFYPEKPSDEDKLEDSLGSRRESFIDPDAPIPNEFSPLGLTRRQIGIVFIGLLLAMFIAALDNNIVSTALPSIVSEFGRLDLYSWVVTAYLLTSTAVVPLIGKLSDIFGRKYIFMGCIVIFLVGSILCGAAQSMIMLIICRAFQGIGGGAMMTLALVIIADIVTLRERGRWTGLMGMIFAASSVLGPVLGGVITTNASWRWIFYINIPIGVIALVVIQFSLKLPGQKARGPIWITLRQIDYAGIFFVVTGIILVLLGTSLGGNQYAWDSVAIILFFVFGGILLICFVATELFVREPIIRMSNFMIRNVGLTDAVAFLIGSLLFGALSYLPIYFQVIHGDTPTTSGLKLLPIMIGLLGTSVISGLLITKTGYFYPFPLFGCIFIALGCGLVGGLLTVDLNLVLLSFYIFLMGVGIGACLQTLTVVVQNSVERTDMASATSAQTFLRSMGGVLGVTVFGTIINNQLNNNVDPQYLLAVNGGYSAILSLPPDVSSQIFSVYNDAIKLIFLVCTGIAGVAVFFAAAIKNQKIQKGAAAATANVEA